MHFLNRCLISGAGLALAGEVRYNGRVADCHYLTLLLNDRGDVGVAVLPTIIWVRRYKVCGQHERVLFVVPFIWLIFEKFLVDVAQHIEYILYYMFYRRRESFDGIFVLFLIPSILFKLRKVCVLSLIKSGHYNRLADRFKNTEVKLLFFFWRRPGAVGFATEIGVILHLLFFFQLTIGPAILNFLQHWIRSAVRNSDAVEDYRRRREAEGQTREHFRAEFLHELWALVHQHHSKERRTVDSLHQHGPGRVLFQHQVDPDLQRTDPAILVVSVVAENCFVVDADA